MLIPLFQPNSDFVVWTLPCRLSLRVANLGLPKTNTNLNFIRFGSGLKAALGNWFGAVAGRCWGRYQVWGVDGACAGVLRSLR